MPSARHSLFALFVGAVILFLVFFSDVTPSYTRIHGSTFPPRPPYRPFHPPPLDNGHLLGSPADSSASRRLWSSRATSIKEAFIHAYHGYEKYAPFPADELLPVSDRGIVNFNGWGVTMVDSLDTMLLLGLEDEFQRAVSQVASIDFTMPIGKHAPFFETIIRYLGGFLSAYALSKEPILLSRAEDLATRLLPAFNTTSGLPVYGINTQSKSISGGMTMFFAEIASCQMEYKYLAHLTGRKEFFSKTDKIMDILVNSQSAQHGMWPTSFYTRDGKPMSNQYSVGAFADSAYEYLLKQYLLSGKTEHRLAEMYMKSMTGVLENLVLISRTRNLVYVTDTSGLGLKPTRKFEHLSCFFPGLLALGAETLPKSVMSDEQRELHMWAAEAIGHTCWVMYADQTSGLGPENVMFDSWERIQGQKQPGHDWNKELWIEHVRKWEEDGRQGGKPPGINNAGMPIKKGAKDYVIYTSSYLLRPETLESMFVLYRTTKDTKWRERGWQIWEAIEARTRTSSGYASVHGVERVDPVPQDSMPSYFLAETVKYAYLIAMDEDPWPSDSYVLNTEAHPLPIFSWRDWERGQFGIGQAEQPKAKDLHVEDAHSI